MYVHDPSCTIFFGIEMLLHLIHIRVPPRWFTILCTKTVPSQASAYVNQCDYIYMRTVAARRTHLTCVEINQRTQ